MALNRVTRPWYNASDNTGALCVETQFYADGSVEVRSSKAPDGAKLAFSRDEWGAFVAGAKNGKFDPEV